MVEFIKYSELSKDQRDKLGFLKIKRLFLRIEQQSFLSDEFNFVLKSSLFNFALKYFDIENEAKICLKEKIEFEEGKFFWGDFRSYVKGLSDFFCSLYEQNRGLFHTFLGFIIKEIYVKHESYSLYVAQLKNIADELKNLGYVLDGDLLKSTSGEPSTDVKITSVIEDELKKINPELLTMRAGAIESLLSNTPDKARHVSASCRTLIDKLLEYLVPKIDVADGESKVSARIKVLFKDSESTSDLIDETAKLIQALNKVQCKGNHRNIDENLAHFVFEMTEKLVFFILIGRKK